MKITQKMRQALLDAQKAQDIYWAALPALEKALGVEVDGTQDLRETTIEYLLEQGKAYPYFLPLLLNINTSIEWQIPKMELPPQIPPDFPLFSDP